MSTDTDQDGLYPTHEDGSPRWAAMRLEDLVTWYDTQVRNELVAARELDINPDVDHPPYRWMNRCYPGFIKRLQREFDLAPTEFYREHVGLPGDDEYDWGPLHDRTVDLLDTYIDELRDVRGSPPTTWRPMRSRLAKYALVYAEVNDGGDLVSGLREEDRRPLEIQAAFDTFAVLDGVLGTPASKQKYLADVRRWYRWLIDTGHAAYNPVERFAQRLGLDTPEWDNPALTREDVRALAAAAQDDRERILVVGLAGWGLRPSELAALRGNQLVFNPRGRDSETREGTQKFHPYITFGDGERKNGPGSVSMLAGADLLNDRLIELGEREGWNGYVFPSTEARDGHITTATLRRWFADIVAHADVWVRGERPTPKYARRFWYTLYGDAARAVADRYELVADEQGSESAAVVIENYLSEDARREEIRAEMHDKLTGLFVDL